MTKKAELEIKRIIKERTGRLIKDLHIGDYACGYVSYMYRYAENEWEYADIKLEDDERWMF